MTQCQTNAGAGISLGGMQPLEKAKDLIVVLGRNADSVVSNAKYPIAIFATRRQVYDRRLVRAVEFHSIADQVLE